MAVAASVNNVSHRYGKTLALGDVSLELPQGKTIGLAGPDGAGKSTLLSLIAAVKKLQTGSVTVLGRDMRGKAARDVINREAAFMPQGLGYNLYPTLSVYENIDFHARLFSIPAAAREARIKRLLDATVLTPFKDRPAGKLSGGMKQKLSLCCALVHDPKLLLLDEPTTGVDPLSRRQFWTLIEDLRQENPEMTIVAATAYIDEAEQFEHFLAMNGGKLIADGATAGYIDEYGDLEAAYNALLPEDKRGVPDLNMPPFVPEQGTPPVMEAHDLTKKFGDFTAVDSVSFTIEKGEIFGFLGSNGCGKSTTMKMLTGLLEPTSGSAELLGKPIDAAGSLETRMNVGYMSQAFSLYEELSVRQNLAMHASLYRMPREKAGAAIDDALKRYDLTEHADSLPKNLSLGMRQRLQLAAACLHRPEILILDEPTSGVDPAARDHFWEELARLSREERVTIFVSTHFMSEAARCDRISFMHRGRVLDMGTPKELQEKQNTDSLEEAFIRYLEEAAPEEEKALQHDKDSAPAGNITGEETEKTAGKTGLAAYIALILTFARRESKELLRDPVRLLFALLGPVLMMASAALAVSFDIRNINFSVLDQDQTVLSRQFADNYRGSSIFTEKPPPASADAAATQLQKGEVSLVITIPPNFGKNLSMGAKPEVRFDIDGAEPFFAQNIKGVSLGVLQQYGQDRAKSQGVPAARLTPSINIIPRYAYNQSFKSVYAIAPGVIMMALMLIPVMMTTLGIVREKEIGSITNLYSSPASSLQFLLGKQIPYLAASMASYFLLVFIAVAIYGVPVTGSFWAMTLGAFLLLFAVTGFGLFVSSLLSSQVAAMAAAAILTMIPAMNFSGMLYPVSAITGGGAVMAQIFPAAHYQRISLGAFTKGQGFANFIGDYLAMITFALVCIALAAVLLKKQEK